MEGKCSQSAYLTEVRWHFGPRLQGWKRAFADQRSCVAWSGDVRRLVRRRGPPGQETRVAWSGDAGHLVRRHGPSGQETRVGWSGEAGRLVRRCGSPGPPMRAVQPTYFGDHGCIQGQRPGNGPAHGGAPGESPVTNAGQSGERATVRNAVPFRVFRAFRGLHRRFHAKLRKTCCI